MKGTLKDHLSQPLLTWQGHLSLDQVALSPIQPDLKLISRDKPPKKKDFKHLKNNYNKKQHTNNTNKTRVCYIHLRKLLGLFVTAPQKSCNYTESLNNVWGLTEILNVLTKGSFKPCL